MNNNRIFFKKLSCILMSSIGSISLLNSPALAQNNTFLPEDIEGQITTIDDNETCTLGLDNSPQLVSQMGINQYAAVFNCDGGGDIIIRRDDSIFALVDGSECGLTFLSENGVPDSTVQRREYLALFDCDGSSSELNFDRNEIEARINGRTCELQIDGQRNVPRSIDDNSSIAMFDCRNDGDTMNFTESAIVEPEPPVIEKPGNTENPLGGLWFDSAGQVTTDLRNPQYILRLTESTPVEIILTSDNTDPAVLLMDRTTSTIYRGDTGNNTSSLNITLDAGEYTVIAGTRLENQSGSFLLSSSVGDIRGSHVEHFTGVSEGFENAYYQKTDPNNLRTTYPDWLAVNGFSAQGQIPGPNEVEATYFNNGDLRLGREMHCIEHDTGNIACATINYGSPGSIDLAESSLQEAVDKLNPLAAVTMEFNPSDPENTVNFAAYNLQSDEQERIEYLQLDNEHAKSVPGVCLDCHAGEFNPETNSVTGATFLPFDIETFKFQEKGEFSEAALSENLRELNAMVKRVNENVGNTTIPSLIDGWYGDPDQVGAIFDKSFIPESFSANRDDRIFYKEVLQKFCLNCHTAIQTPALDMVNSNAALIKAFVQPFLCQTQTGIPVMPHAEASDIQFWENELAQRLLIDDVDACRETRFGEGFDNVTP